mmetsp:Transcript_13354/g.42717  ORF Transcript_13354/g.42717 Transcript_13354/m.42717 type:complete len:207 (-) Transcript_13354:633-1253(-)
MRLSSIAILPSSSCASISSCALMPTDFASLTVTGIRLTFFDRFFSSAGAGAGAGRGEEAVEEGQADPGDGERGKVGGHERAGADGGAGGGGQDGDRGQAHQGEGGRDEPARGDDLLDEGQAQHLALCLLDGGREVASHGAIDLARGLAVRGRHGRGEVGLRRKVRRDHGQVRPDRGAGARGRPEARRDRRAAQGARALLRVCEQLR